MERTLDPTELIRSARLGDKEALDRLSELAQKRLRQHVYRLTLREDLTNDIVQESMMAMVKEQDRLPEAERFWPWLFTISRNRLRFHYKNRDRKKTVALSTVGDVDLFSDNCDEGLAKLISDEFRKAVLVAVKKLSLTHKTVLTMRCYEDMDYSQIAESLGCSRFAAKVSFYRARKALQKQLARQGFDKTLLLVGLVLYGKMTAATEAAAANITLVPAATKVGTAAALTAVATSKPVIVMLATASVLGIGERMIRPDETPGLTVAGEVQVGREHTVVRNAQARDRDLEYRYFFPEGPGRAIMMRVMKCDEDGRPSYCQILQNEHANYEYDERSNTVYINNFRMWDDEHLTVTHLPTDNNDSVMNAQGGLLMTSRHDPQGGEGFVYTYHRNALGEKDFQFNWAEKNTIDRRDEMHKRGWTYFTIAGQLNGNRVAGTGRVPFVYAESRLKHPWLRLRVGDTEFMDTDGTLFAGLSRPWTGLHSIDIVRRDALQQSLVFETRYNPDSDSTEITIRHDSGEMIYTIDMEKDVVERIDFVGDVAGRLELAYLQEIDNLADEFARPRANQCRGLDGAGILWISRAVEEELAR